MTDGEPDPTAQSDLLTQAYFRLKELGIGLDEGTYSNSNLLAMKHAIEV
jgi:hypothetical protein